MDMPYPNWKAKWRFGAALPKGLDAVIVNPSIIIGPNAGTEGSGALFEIVRKGLKFIRWAAVVLLMWKMWLNA